MEILIWAGVADFADLLLKLSFVSLLSLIASKASLAGGCISATLKSSEIAIFYDY